MKLVPDITDLSQTENSYPKKYSCKIKYYTSSKFTDINIDAFYCFVLFKKSFTLHKIQRLMAKILPLSISNFLELNIKIHESKYGITTPYLENNINNVNILILSC